MRIGVFTPLLSQMPLDKILRKLKIQGIDTVELGIGNYPGDAHCKLSMLEDEPELRAFRPKLADHGFSISALMLSWQPVAPGSRTGKAQSMREQSNR